MNRAAAVDLAVLAKHDAFCVGLGIELVEASLGRAVTRVKVGVQHLNFHGACHGGLTFTLADAAFGFACNSRGVASSGIDTHMIYNRPVKAGDVLTATAVEISPLQQAVALSCRCRARRRQAGGRTDWHGFRQR